MPEDATRPAGWRWTRAVASIAIAVSVVGVFSTWTNDGPVSLNGTQGPHDGWLVVILAVPAFFWARSMARGSWVGIVGVLGTAVVMGWTALGSWLDSPEVASVGYGLVLVIGASLALAAAGVVRGLELAHIRH